MTALDTAAAAPKGLTPRLARRLTVPRLRLMQLIAQRGGADGWTVEPLHILLRAAGYNAHSGGRADRSALADERFVELRQDPRLPRRGGRVITQARLTALGQAVRTEALYALFGDLLEGPQP